MTALDEATRIGLLGDTHGNLGDLAFALGDFHQRGIRTIVQLGDFGFVWSDSSEVALDHVSDMLVAYGQQLWFVDGNHENFPLLYGYPLSEDGTRRMRDNIHHLPRGYRTTLHGGRTLAVLGGANSIDRHHRREGYSWWADESITEEDLKLLGDEPADIMLGHDAPAPLPDLDGWLRDATWEPSGVAYARGGRAMFTRGFLQVKPALYVGGHFHHHVDQTHTYESPTGSFDSRVVVLDQASGRGVRQADLTAETIELTFWNNGVQT